MYTAPVTGRMRQLILAGQIANWILAQPNGATFTEIAERFPEAIGEDFFAFSDMPNVMLWDKLSFTAREALAALVNDGYLACKVVPASEYPAAQWPHYPQMKSTPAGNPRQNMWCPVRWYANPAAFSEEGAL